jgi:hypothetical protein
MTVVHASGQGPVDRYNQGSNWRDVSRVFFGRGIAEGNKRDDLGIEWFETFDGCVQFLREVVLEECP